MRWSFASRLEGGGALSSEQEACCSGKGCGHLCLQGCKNRGGSSRDSLTGSGRGTGGSKIQLFLLAGPSEGWSKAGPHKEEQLTVG